MPTQLTRTSRPPNERATARTADRASAINVASPRLTTQPGRSAASRPALARSSSSAPAATRRVRVGTAVANAALRPPVLAAKTAAQLDQAAGGRFILGLGVGNAVMNARFGVAPAAPPLRLVEEYVEVIRSVLTLAPGYDGQVFRTGMIPLDSRPVRADLPVYLGALGPRMLALAGRVADGVILNLMTPAQAGQAAGLVRGAARAAGRDPASVEVACVVHCC